VEHRTKRLCSNSIAVSVLLCAVATSASGQGVVGASEPEPPYQLSNPQTYRLKVSVRVGAGGQPLRRVTAMAPVPIDWREQQVELLGEEKPRGVTTRDVALAKHAAVMSVRIPMMPAGSEAVVERVYRVTRHEIRFTGDLDSLRAPARVSAEMRQYLRASPGIETTDRQIRQLALSLKDEAGDVQTARGMFDWVRGHVKYRLDKYRGARFALAEKIGDCEDMSALFIALCRIAGIPARLVWVEGHAYAEIFLEDADGHGYWIPAQLNGPAWFGRMTEYRVILQKGDRVRNPVSRKYEHYAPQTLIAFGGTATLEVKYTRLESDDGATCCSARVSDPAEDPTCCSARVSDPAGDPTAGLPGQRHN